MKRYVFSFFLIVSPIIFKAQNFTWAKAFGSPGVDEAYSLVVDEAGNVITVGYFSTAIADLDPGEGVATFNSAGNYDIFIQKLDVNGNYLWAKQIGFIGDDLPYDVKLDEAGNIYITGYYTGTVDFDPGPGQHDLPLHGSKDIFVLKLDMDGNFLWAHGFGATQNDHGASLSLDDEGNVSITGLFGQTVDFDPGAGVHNLVAQTSDYYSSYVLTLDTNGNFLWANALTSAIDVFSSDIAHSTDGSVHICGYYYGSFDANPSEEVLMTPDAISTAGFVIKYNAYGELAWVKTIDGDGGENCITIATSGSQVIVGGAFQTEVNFDPGSTNTTLAATGMTDIFLVKFDGNGVFEWGKSAGGTSPDQARNLVTDDSGNIYCIGTYYGSVDFDPGPGENMLPGTDLGYSVFIEKFTGDGSYVWAGGISTMNVYSGSIDLGLGGSVYACGSFTSTGDFNPQSDEHIMSSAGSSDAFIVKWNDGPVDVQETFNDVFNIYPNPSVDKCTIMSAAIIHEVSVFDMNGSMLRSMRPSAQNFELDLPLAPGVYFVRILSADGLAATRRMIRQ